MPRRVRWQWIWENPHFGILNFPTLGGKEGEMEEAVNDLGVEGGKEGKKPEQEPMPFLFFAL